MRTFALVFVLVSACRGDSPPVPDGGPKCAGALYDLCSTEHDCTSAMCHLFTSDGFQVCTQQCDTTTPCPADESGNPGTCNAMMICKPAAANTCHL
jgi:hypothetical protein